MPRIILLGFCLGLCCFDSAKDLSAKDYFPWEFRHYQATLLWILQASKWIPLPVASLDFWILLVREREKWRRGISAEAEMSRHQKRGCWSRAGVSRRRLRGPGAFWMVRRTRKGFSVLAEIPRRLQSLEGNVSLTRLLTLWYCSSLVELILILASWTIRFFCEPWIFSTETCTQEIYWTICRHNLHFREPTILDYSSICNGIVELSFGTSLCLFLRICGLGILCLRCYTGMKTDLIHLPCLGFMVRNESWFTCFTLDLW